MGRKRANGEGTIWLDKQGYWNAKIMIGYQPTGAPKFKTFSGKTQAIVKQKLEEYKRAAQMYRADYGNKMTVGEFMEDWYRGYVIDNVKTSTRTSYEGIIRNHIMPHIGRIKLIDLKMGNLEGLYKRLLDEGNLRRSGGLSIKSVHNVALVIHKALNEAVRREYIPKNPADIAKVPTHRSTNTAKREMQILSHEEQRRLLDVCGNDVYGMAVRTALFTGVRLGELLGIQWKDIGWEKKTVMINKQLNRQKDYNPGAEKKTRLGLQLDTKTKNSTRTITLNDDLARRLHEYQLMQKEHSLQWGADYHRLDMVFAREDGNYIDSSTFRSKYIKLLEKAGLQYYKIHELRHTFATRALESGVPDKVASKILGHASIQTTLDIYSHVLPKTHSDAMNRIAEYVGK